MRIVCIYPGRFNPFHSSHYAVYKYLTSKFGSKNVYIVTSDIVKDKSPFTFKEKAFIMNKMFKIPYSNILQKNEPYKAEKLTSEFDPNNTVLVYVSTEKDPGRTVGRYFKGQLPKNPKPYKQQAYIINIPLIHNTIQGQEVSGTTIRNLFSSKNLSIQQKKKIFKQIFGKYDQSVFKLMINKLSNQKESLLRQKVQNVKFLDKTLNHILSGRFPITNKQFSQLNKNKITYSFHYCDVNGFKKLLAIQGTAKVISTTSANDIVMFRWGMWSEGGICCFLRGNFLVGDTVDLGTSPDETGRRWISRITAVFNSDLIAQKWYNYVRYLKNVWNKYSEKEQNDPKIKYEFIKRFFNHHSSFIEKYKKYYIPWNINKPPMASYDQVLLNRIKIISICALQKNKKLLAPYQNKFPITYVGHNEQSQFTKWYNSCRSLIKQETFNTKNNRILLTCGGASGHTLHIFQDTQLTFNDLKIIINNLLSGKINLESEASIKYDGQNINVSWKNGKLVGARNKGHFKNFGQTALDIMGMKKMFQGRGAIQEAFVYAMIDLQRAFSNLSKKELDQIFGNGRKWLSLEIIYPKTANVIPYDRSMLIFHNVTEVNENGNIVKIDNSMAKSLYSILTSVNANVQKHFSINPPTIVNLPQITNFSERKKYYLSKLNVLQQKYKLSVNSTLQDYNDAYWENLIKTKAMSFNYNIPKELLNLLITRWSRFDTSASLNKIKAICDNPEFFNWIKEFDKRDHYAEFKRNAYDWQTLFMQLTSQVLRNLGEYLKINPESSVQKISSELLLTAEQVRNSNNLKLIDKVNKLMDRINKLGGVKNIVPIQGIVFTYKGKIYKATGLFPDVNQIMGALKYAR